MILKVKEFSEYQNISKKINEKKIIKCIEKSEDSDLYELLGDFYFDVVKNKDSNSYLKLLEGCEFEVNNETFIHKGLKDLISDFAFARYMYDININITPFGANVKYTQDSNQVDRTVLKDVSKQTQIDANIKFKIIQKYILSESALFSRYKSVCGCSTNGINKSRFGEIKLTKL